MGESVRHSVMFGSPQYPHHYFWCKSKLGGPFTHNPKHPCDHVLFPLPFPLSAFPLPVESPCPLLPFCQPPFFPPLARKIASISGWASFMMCDSPQSALGHVVCENRQVSPTSHVPVVWYEMHFPVQSNGLAFLLLPFHLGLPMSVWVPFP